MYSMPYLSLEVDRIGKKIEQFSSIYLVVAVFCERLDGLMTASCAQAFLQPHGLEFPSSAHSINLFIEKTYIRLSLY